MLNIIYWRVSQSIPRGKNNINTVTDDLCRQLQHDMLHYTYRHTVQSTKLTTKIALTWLKMIDLIPTITTEWINTETLSKLVQPAHHRQASRRLSHNPIFRQAIRNLRSKATRIEHFFIKSWMLPKVGNQSPVIRLHQGSESPCQSKN